MINVVSRRNHKAIITVGCDEFETGIEKFIIPITDTEYEFLVERPKEVNEQMFHEVWAILIDRLYIRMVEKFGDVFSDPGDYDRGEDWDVESVQYE